MNIMVVTNSKFLKPTYLMLCSLFHTHGDEPMDIYLPYEDLTGQELQELGSYVASHEGKRLYPLYVGNEFKKRVASRNGIAVETYYRILGLDLLPQSVERILYLDADMIIKGSLRELYETPMDGAPFVVCEDIYGVINGFHEANKRRLGIPEEYSYFNAGVMLFHLTYLRETNAVATMIENIYQHFERYEYNDQDVMNELYFDNAIFAGWDEYNCPPAWYYINRDALAGGTLAFADYEDMKEFQTQPEKMQEYINITQQIYNQARIIHYLGDTKPWSTTRKSAKVYEIFDQAYQVYSAIREKEA